MRNRNIYKDIVMLAAWCLCIAAIVQAAGFWLRQQKSYGLSLQSGTELTEGIVKEIGKIEGVYAFIPISSCNVKLRLEEYEMETQVLGIDLDSYPLKWKQAQEEFTLGNTVVLFFGQETFSAFADEYGNCPGKSEIAQWMEQYKELELKVTDDGGRERPAKIGGILAEPSAGLFMSGSQMQEIYQPVARTSGGCAKIRGEKNLQRAKELLSGAGFQIEEIPSP